MALTAAADSMSSRHQPVPLCYMSGTIEPTLVTGTADRTSDSRRLSALKGEPYAGELGRHQA
jgi:hypothetical protein